ncbi:MAG: apolipoprotein N-acyltransferase, partial [Pseudomonadota bacterium]
FLQRAQECASRAWRAFKTAWWFGFGYFFFGLFWIGEAFLVEAETFAVFLPFAITLMPAGLSLFWATAVATASLFWRPGLQRVVVLAVAIFLAEYARGHLFTGFPWNVLGYALTWPLQLMQATSVLSVYALTALAVLIFAAPLVALSDTKPTEHKKLSACAAAIASALVLAALFAFGQARLSNQPTDYVEGVRLRLVQPSTPQGEKWLAKKQSEIFQTHLDLSARNENGQPDGLAGVTHVIWPEAAMPFLPLSTPQAMAMIGDLLPEKTLLISGALRVNEARPTASTAAAQAGELYGVGQLQRRVYNSMMTFGTNGNLVALYDKTHLVPFGEYLPYSATLEAWGLQSLTRLRGGFTVGRTPRPLVAIPGLPASAALICYEIIFPGAAVQTDAHPGLLINVTNDGWFGNTVGPYQHYHQARVRAVELGVPLIRSANNGISAVVDPLGRELHRLDLNAIGTLDANLPKPVGVPFVSRFGHAADVLLVLLLICAVLLKNTVGRLDDAPTT